MKLCVENVVGTGENAGYRYFLHFPQDYQRVVFFLRVVKPRFIFKELSM